MKTKLKIRPQTLDHYAFVTNRLRKMVKFYVKILGLKEIEASPEAAKYGIAWLSGTSFQIHLIPLEAAAAMIGKKRIRKPRHPVAHLAIRCTGLCTGKIGAQWLKRQGVVVEKRIPQGYPHRIQIFVKDPDGNTIELCQDLVH